jgi:hypothetical protein
MSNATDLGMSEAFECAIVDYCVQAVKAGREMSRDLMIEAMHSALRQQVALLDDAEAIRLVSDRIWCNLHESGAPVKRLIDAETLAAAPPEAQELLARFRTDGL